MNEMKAMTIEELFNPSNWTAIEKSLDPILVAATSDKELLQLATLINRHKDELPFTRLSLKINVESMQQPGFQELITALNDADIESLQLVLNKDECVTHRRADMAALVDKVTSNHIHYPIVFCESEKLMISTHKDFHRVMFKLITNTQQENCNRLFNTEAAAPKIVEEKKVDLELAANPSDEEIRLKELIYSRANDNSYQQYIKLEVQHVQFVDQLEEQIVEEETDVNISAEMATEVTVEEQQSLQKYQGKLVNYEEFKNYIGNDQTSIVKYSRIKNELFANLPQAIRYISPDAAKELAANMDNYFSINKENLPQNFILKKTNEGEFVLDFMADLEENKGNVYTAKALKKRDYKPIYNINLKQEHVQSLINNDRLFRRICITPPFVYSDNQLKNLWIRYGDRGMAHLFERLNEIDTIHPEFSVFFYDSYLKYFPQWDHFLDNKNFLDSLALIQTYSDAKLNCLKRFMENTGSSHHDLSDTLHAFEKFWYELEVDCKNRNADISKINSNWTTPEGNPVVYMERLATILKNSRRLDEQMECLNGLHLDSYGAYYASKYEDFKIVSKQMGFSYDADKQNKQQFNTNYKLYRIDLNKLYEFEKQFEQYTDKNQTITFDEFYQLIYRFMGGQTNGVYITQFQNDYQTFMSRKYTYFTTEKGWIRTEHQNNIATILFSSLFYISHERYTGTNIYDLFQYLKSAIDEKTVLYTTNKYLVRLYNMDIKLNEIEGKVLSNRIADMNVFEFTRFKFDKAKVIFKLFSHLENNKYATLKLLSTFSGSRFPIIFALDTADFLATDPVIAANYRDDLLLFSELINKVGEQAYSIENKESHTAAIISNLELVKSYLAKAARGEDPNHLHYAINRIIEAQEVFSYSQFINAMAEIDALERPFDYQKIDAILLKYEFKLKSSLPAVFMSDNTDLKSMMVSLIISLRNIKESGDHPDITACLKAPESVSPVERDKIENDLNNYQGAKDDSVYKELDKKYQDMLNKIAIYEGWLKKYDDLARFDCSELQEILDSEWKESGSGLASAGRDVLKPILINLKNSVISSAFTNFSKSKFAAVLAYKIRKMKEFDSCDNFEKVNQISKMAKNLVANLSSLLSKEYFKKNEIELTEALNAVDFSHIDYKTCFALFNLFNAMPQRAYAGIFKILFNNTILKNQKKTNELIDIISNMDANALPTHYIERIASLFAENNSKPNFIVEVQEIITIFVKDNNDSIIKMLMESSFIGFDQLCSIIKFTNKLITNRENIATLFAYIGKNKNLELTPFIEELDRSKQADKILDIIAKSFSTTLGNQLSSATINFSDLVKSISNIGNENIARLYEFFQKNSASIPCLYHNLIMRDKTTSFETFLLEFEKAPYGKRDFSSQFDCSQVARVINEAKDLINKTPYSYQYRKQMMEAFLFVNQIGHDLPVYQNLAAKDLSNQQIQDIFQDIKAGQYKHLSPFQRRLYALGLMREAMYRSTGQFPYSTQIIALIDCMMHEVDVISSIDTGQGKSLIDVMKASLLWLEGTRTDVTTSSIVDAKRDISIYSPFLQLMGIPYSKTAITSTSKVGEDYQMEGLNFSTFSQLSLFYSRVKSEGKPSEPELDLDNGDHVVSLVMNESDFSLLDDRTIYRLASNSSHSPGIGNEWVYYAINAFVNQEQFKRCRTSEKQDVMLLREFLKDQAVLNGKTKKFVNRFDDAQLLKWIKSAILVNYKLRENIDFVFTDTPELIKINGEARLTLAAKILLKDGKVSPDNQYGNGIQQLLYAKLNDKYKREAFVIEPETKTILSSNNKNLVNYYRARHGFIWGDSGTPGSEEEMQEQLSKFGFEFSKISPHQAKIVKGHEAVFLDDEISQFYCLLDQINLGNRENKGVNNLIFCKDIDTANRLFKFLRENYNKNQFIQVYSGMGNEEEVIENAAKPGAITITTSALGRNTDILYNKKIGMNVFQTYVDSARGTGQKSGRTGRQGSPGNLYFTLNKQDMGELTVNQIQTIIDKRSAQERQINEELYDLLDYMLHRIELVAVGSDSSQVTDVLKVKWPEFCAIIEENYHKFKTKGNNQLSDFIKKSIELFNQKFDKQLIADSVIADLNRLHLPPEEYEAADKDVELSDCVSPTLIAYHLLQFKSESTLSKEDESNIEAKLELLFKSLEQGKYSESNRDYIQYLSKGNHALAGIQQVHQKFISQYLSKIAGLSAKRHFFERWFGHDSILKKIANNVNYLLTFKALANLKNPSSKVEVKALKDSITALLDEYLDRSWFINLSRRNECNHLKKLIDKAVDIKELVLILSKTKITVIEKDISANKQSFFRKLRKINPKGKSRLQDTLDTAINLASAVSGEDIPSSLVSDMTKALKKVVSNEQVLNKFTKKSTIDTYSKAAKSLTATDKGNAKILKEGIEKVLTSELQAKPERGMLGRHTIFKPKDGGHLSPAEKEKADKKPGPSKS